MKDINIIRRLRYLVPCLCCAVVVLFSQGCSDDPTGDSYYSFTGEMMSDYLTNRPQYSEFAYIVDQAGLTDLLSAYGHYTMFLPDNDALNTYLQKIGKSSVQDLTKEECDTIARTHLVNNIYSTMDMNAGTLNTANMNNRYIQITDTIDSASNAVKMLNRSAIIIFAEKDDSVENGIVQPIDKVLEMSNSSVGNILQENPNISIFYKGLEATGLVDSLYKTIDPSYDATAYGQYTYTSDFWHEVAVAPDEKKYGFTAFVEPNSVYMNAFQEKGISVDTTSTESTLHALYDLAVSIYDPVYGNDADYQAAKDFSKLTERWNPLNLFIAYHILTRDVIGWNKLTPLEITGRSTEGDGAIGIKTDLMDPNDWYETMMPNHNMMKLVQSTVRRDIIPESERGQRFINRRIDDVYNVRGAKVEPTIEDQYLQDGPNGRYFYVDDIVAFDYTTQNIVFNDRIRMDFSTVWPELMTENIRLNGDPKKDDESGTADLTFVNGKNYYFPQGYLDNVTFRGSGGYLVYRRPHWNFWSYEGDEFNLKGDYDFEFRLPPVPYEGEWQVRLGFCAITGKRGVAQIYFDGKPQGIPIDMNIYLNDESILGNKWNASKTWSGFTDDEKADDQKILKNLGYYRGPYGGFHTSGSSINEFVDNYRTYRRVLCQVHINPKQDHTLRIRCTSKSGNNGEFMIDYLELVPKSVYGVTGAGQMETDL